ncbi:MAG: DUF2953 domain-containing protein [Oscillospiraceae bacterium]|nr:DUF2953 domain-containing protein [Oscillospiraceae bacterium]
MGWAIFLSILFVLCVIFLLPIRVKASFGGGKWSVAVYYAFIRVFRKESAPPPPPPEVPPKPENVTLFEPGVDPPPESVPLQAEGEAPAVIQPGAKPEKPEQPEKPKSDKKDEKKAKKEEKKRRKEKKKKEKEEAAAAEHAAETDKPDAQTEDDPKKKKKKPGFFKRLKPHSLHDILGLVKDGFASLTPAVRFLLRHFHFRHVKVYAAIASDDPANTATLYGKICAAAFNLLAQLQRLFDFQTDEFRILADFYGEKPDYRGSLELRVSPAALILTVLILGCKFLWRTWRRFRREDKEEKRREKESAPLPAAQPQQS